MTSSSRTAREPRARVVHVPDGTTGEWSPFMHDLEALGFTHAVGGDNVTIAVVHPQSTDLQILSCLARTLATSRRLVVDLSSDPTSRSLLRPAVRLSIRLAGVVITGSSTQGVRALEHGVPLAKVHVAPLLFPSPLTSPPTADPDAPVLVSARAATALSGADLGRPVHLVGPSAGGSSLGHASALVDLGAPVLTTPEDPDLPPWAVVCRGRRPLVIGCGDDDDLIRLDAAVPVDTSEIAHHLTASAPFEARLVELGRGRHAPAAVLPRRAHALACALGT